ncbi:MAG: hypothetical protein RMK73_03045 [Geminicoccaceae bacterium]|nr:hypothetical protein [Geminicoccaceae bacterium]MDW8340441.1 hypothetical protein [Geminicoccaceae bacterium]
MWRANTVGTFGLGTRRRQQRPWLFLLVLAAGLGAGFLALGTAYLVGLAQGERERARLSTELEAAREDMRAAVARAAALEERLVRAMRAGGPAPARAPTRPELEPLVQLLEQRLAEGVAADRLARAIRALPRAPVCDATIEAKTVPVAITPNRDAGTRSFAGNRFAVSARGVPAKSPTGRAEAWFDPAQPVELTIREAGKDPQIAAGPLPLQQAFVLERREYRFSARAGDRRGVLEVRLEICDYP